MVIIREEPVFLIAVSGLLFGLSLFNESMLEKLQYLIIILFLAGILSAWIFRDSMPSIIKIITSFIAMMFCGTIINYLYLYLYETI